MSRLTWQSKFKHVYASPLKKESSYENVRVTNSAWDSNLVSCNSQFLAVNWQINGGGAFGIDSFLS
jgi:coronin-1B/1C/6